MKTAAIVPAYNEQDRISAVLEAVGEARTVDEIVVVCDGCTDDTCTVAASHSSGPRIVVLETNRGKGGAMRAGAESTDANVVLFLDADLTGLDGDKVDSLLEPVLDDRADMSIGIFRHGRKATDIAQFLAPYISGQRAMRRSTFLEIPELDRARSGVETAITKFFRSRGLRVERVALPGCSHHMKEEKMGFTRGFASRLRMYVDIGRILLDGRAYKQRPPAEPR